MHSVYVVGFYEGVEELCHWWKYGDRQGGKTTAHAWESIKHLEIKNGERNLEFYHEIKDQFPTYNMDFRPES